MSACVPLAPQGYWEFIKRSELESKIGLNSSLLFSALQQLSWAAADCRACDHRVGSEERKQYSSELRLQLVQVLRLESEIEAALRVLGQMSTEPETRKIPCFLLEGSLMRKGVARDVLNSLSILLSRPKPQVDMSLLDSKQCTVLLSDFCTCTIRGQRQHSAIRCALSALGSTYARWEQGRREAYHKMIPSDCVDRTAIQVQCDNPDAKPELAPPSPEHLQQAERFIQVSTVGSYIGNYINYGRTHVFESSSEEELTPLLQSILDAACHIDNVAQMARQECTEILQSEERIQSILARDHGSSYIRRLFDEQSRFRAHIALCMLGTVETLSHNSDEPRKRYASDLLAIFPKLSVEQNCITLGPVSMSLDPRFFEDRGRADRRITDRDFKLYLLSWQKKIQVWHDIEIPRLLREAENAKNGE